MLSSSRMIPRSMLTARRNMALVPQPRKLHPRHATLGRLSIYGGVRTMAAASAGVEYDMSIEEIKAALLDSFWGTDRGLSASTDVRADINELITQLEAKTPVENPTQAMEKLNGTWKLAYTSNSELIALLALGKLPLVKVHDIRQSIDGVRATVVNTLDIELPGSRTTVSTTAAVVVESPKRVSLKFEKSTINTPQLMTELNLPDYTTVLGQNVDLRWVKSILQPLDDASRDVRKQLADLISRQPNLDIPIPTERAETWLLTTYLDDSLRISRGDQGSIFVLTRESAQPSGTSSSAATGMMQSRQPNRTTIEGIANDVGNRVQSTAQDLQQEGERLAQRVRDTLQDPAQAVRDASRAVDEEVQKAVDTSGTFASESAQAVKDASQSVDANVRRAVDAGERFAEDPARKARSAIRWGNAAVKGAAEDVASDPDV